ncbi:hypothetical protein [Stenotrophomonas bentonitica]
MKTEHCTSLSVAYRTKEWRAVPKALDHQTHRIFCLLNGPCDFPHPEDQPFEDLPLGISMELSVHLLVVLNQHIPVGDLYTQTSQDDQEPLNFLARLDGVHRRRKPKELPVGLQKPLIRCSPIFQQVHRVFRAIFQVLERDLKVKDREATTDTVLSHIRPIRQQDSEEGSYSGRPRTDRCDGIPPDHAVSRTQAITSKNSPQPNHSLIPLWAGGHFGTERADGVAPISLATIKPPRNLRTKLREDR